jgi:hypothetical protein
MKCFQIAHPLATMSYFGVWNFGIWNDHLLCLVFRVLFLILDYFIYNKISFSVALYFIIYFCSSILIFLICNGNLAFCHKRNKWQTHRAWHKLCAKAVACKASTCKHFIRHSLKLIYRVSYPTGKSRYHNHVKYNI